MKRKIIAAFLVLCVASLTVFAGIRRLQVPRTTIDIFFIATDSWVPHLGAAIVSILVNSEKDEAFRFYVLTSDISPENRTLFNRLKKIKPFEIEFIDVGRDRFRNLKITRLKMETYYRYVIPELKPRLRKALYLDSDLIVRSSLKELWNTDLTGVYAAAVENGGDNQTRLGLNKYFNAGIILFNLDLMRRDNMVEKLFENTRKMAQDGILQLEDQDVLNYTFRDRVRFVPQKYNTPGYTKKNTDQVVILHYVIYKPWRSFMNTSAEYFKYRNMTPWPITEKMIPVRFLDGSKTYLTPRDGVFCRADSGRCGVDEKLMFVDWGSGDEKLFYRQDDGILIERYPKELYLKHPDWEDFATVNNSGRVCLRTEKVCGRIVRRIKDLLTIRWPKVTELYRRNPNGSYSLEPIERQISLFHPSWGRDRGIIYNNGRICRAAADDCGRFREMPNAVVIDWDKWASEVFELENGVYRFARKEKSSH